MREHGRLKWDGVGGQGREKSMRRITNSKNL